MEIKIKKIRIVNFKCFQDFCVELNAGMNILVGDNEAGKSTVLQAILLALCCSFEGRPLKYSLSQYLFNRECINRYLSNIKNKPQPPAITIEIYFADATDTLLTGKNFLVSAISWRYSILEESRCAAL